MVRSLLMLATATVEVFLVGHATTAMTTRIRSQVEERLKEYCTLREYGCKFED